MSDRVETFQVGQTVRVVAKTRSGDIRVLAGDPGSVLIAIDGNADSFEINQTGDVITVESRRRGLIGSSSDVTLTVPAVAVVDLSCSSGDIDVQGEIGELKASVASGDVRADKVTTICRVNSASGDITLGSASEAEINTASGTVRIDAIARDLRINSASGDAFIGEVGGSFRSKLASGTIRIDAMRGGEVRHKSMSGDLYLGIPPRRTVELDYSSLSGRLHNRVSRGDGSPSEKLLVLSVNTVSGNLNLLDAI